MIRFVFMILLFSIFLFSSEHSGMEAAKLFATKVTGSMHSVDYKKKLPKDYDFLVDIIDNIDHKKPVLTISYLTSSSVPYLSHVYFSENIRKLKKEFNIQGKMCMRGIESHGFGVFVNKMMTKLEESGENQMGLDFCPDLFDELNVTTVPAFVISVCDTPFLHVEECAPKYIIRGDAPMKFIFQMLAEENPYFKEMYEAL